VRTIDDNGEVETFEVKAADFVVDGTGAGDAFAAGFLCGHAAGAQLAQRVAAAQAVAARVVARAGATLEDA
jgi:sugar/nucleoside kinase (ribokinase family)